MQNTLMSMKYQKTDVILPPFFVHKEHKRSPIQFRSATRELKKEWLGDEKISESKNDISTDFQD